MLRFVKLIAVACLLTALAFGQAVTIASLGGVVTDQSGSGVPGATVRMIDTEKGTVHTTVSDAEGRYSFPNLPVGTYRLEAMAKGFKGYAQAGFVLEVAANRTQNIQLEVGAVTEVVEVSAAASMVETKDNSISQVIEERKIVDLPLNGRNL